MIKARLRGECQKFPGTALAALLVAVVVVSSGYGIVLPILPLMLQVIDGPNAAAEVARHTGLLTGVYALALFLFAPIWGWLSDQHGRRRILVVGLVGFGASLLLSSIKPTIGLLYTERFLTGAFAASITPVASAVIADQGGSDSWRARHLAWVSMASISGFLLGPMLSGFLATLSTTLTAAQTFARQSYELPFLAISTLAFVAALAVSIWLSPGRMAHSSDLLKAGAVSPGNTSTIWRLRAIGFVVAAGVGAFEVGLALRGNQDLGIGPRQVAFMFTTCSGVMFVVQAMVFSPIVRPTSTRWLIAPALAVMAAALLLMPQTGEYASLLTIVAIVAASAGILFPILTFWISFESGKAKGAELGKQTAVTNLGQAIGSFAGGALFAGAGVSAASIVLAALLLAAAAIACWRLPRRLGYQRAASGDIVSKSWVRH